VLKHPHLAKPWRSPQLIIRELIGGTVGPTIRGVMDSIRDRRPDVIVRHHISLGSRWIAEREKIPCVTCVLAPTFWFNDHDPAVHGRFQIEEAPPWLVRLRLEIGRFVLRFMYDRPLNAQRREHGFTPERDLFRREIERTDMLLGLWSPVIRPRMQGDPPHASVCGFCVFDRAPEQESRDDSLRAFLDSCGSERPLVFTLGTSVVHHHGGFYELAARVAARLGRRAVLLTGSNDYAPRELPRGVFACAYAPYTGLFERASVVVHHGGVGTTGAALRAGTPTVIVPFANDEFDNARRAKLMGCSVTLHVGQLSERALGGAIERAAGLAPTASRVGEAMREERGAATASDLIERLIHEQATSSTTTTR
jgi:UDP:flavonoid glycosyltransferase YjiC (YdhE family)